MMFANAFETSRLSKEAPRGAKVISRSMRIKIMTPLRNNWIYDLHVMNSY